MIRNTLFVVVLAALPVAASIASAGTLTAIDAIDSIEFPQLIASPSDRIFGWEFSPQAEIAITEIGWLDVDGDGLVDSHEIGIWTSAGELLHSAVVRSNDELHGPSRYVSIPALTLTPLESYVIAGVQPRFRCVPEQATCFDEPPNWLAGTQIISDLLVLQSMDTPVDDHITLLAGRSGPSVDATLAFPGDVYELSNGFHVGPNFQFVVVPEPSGMVLIVVGLLLLLSLRPRRGSFQCLRSREIKRDRSNYWPWKAQQLDLSRLIRRLIRHRQVSRGGCAGRRG